MKVRTLEEIEQEFHKALEACDVPNVKSNVLGVLAGSLSLSIEARINHIKKSVVQSNESKNEIIRLQKAASCFNEKINSTNGNAFKNEIRESYKAYANVH